MIYDDQVNKILNTEEKVKGIKRITKKAQRIVDETLARADSLSKEAIRRFPFAEKGQGQIGEVKGESPLAKLSIKSLYTLEKLDSQIRHSVVEVCFYNLKLLCQVFKDKYNQPRFIEKFKENVNELSLAKSRLEDYFQYKLEGEITIVSLFEEEADKIDEELEYITELLAEWESRYESFSYREQVSSIIPEKIDLIMSLLGRVKSALEEAKVSLGELINKAIDLHSERLKERNIDIILDVAISSDRIFAHRESLIDIFCELIRNAIRHGFEDFSGREKRNINIEIASLNQTHRNVKISFSDNGIGLDEKNLTSIRNSPLSNSGLSVVKRVVENEHFGNFNINGGLEKGTVVTMVLPAEL